MSAPIILHKMRCAAAALAAISLCIVLAVAHAEAVFPRIHIAERGVYRAETVQRGSPNEKGAIINTVQSARLIVSTTSILAEVGVRFGLRYSVIGPPGYSPELKLVIRFPPGGLRDPATRQILFQSEFDTAVIAGATNYWEYHFENEWEVVGGIWSFEFWHQDKKLTEQQFCVSEMKALSKPDFAAACGAGLFR